MVIYWYGVGKRVWCVMGYKLEFENYKFKIKKGFFFWGIYLEIERDEMFKGW